jgi:hypothetical protein
MSSDENGQLEFDFENSFSEIWYETPPQPQLEIQIGVSDTVELKEKL